MKREYEKAVKKSVSMPEIMLDDAEQRRRALRLSTFSDYIQHLIRKDTIPAQEQPAMAA
jgi:hypothetical protein